MKLWWRFCAKRRSKENRWRGIFQLQHHPTEWRWKPMLKHPLTARRIDILPCSGCDEKFVFVRLYESQSLRIEWNLREWPIATLIFPPCPRSKWFPAEIWKFKTVTSHSYFANSQSYSALPHRSQTNKVGTFGFAVIFICFCCTGWLGFVIIGRKCGVFDGLYCSFSW